MGEIVMTKSDVTIAAPVSRILISVLELRQFMGASILYNVHVDLRVSQLCGLCSMFAVSALSRAPTLCHYAL